VILEFDTPKITSLPVPLLLRLIRMNDQLVKDFIEKYFNQALQSFFDYQRQVEEQMRQTHGLTPAFPSSITAWTQAMLNPFASAFESGKKPAETGTRDDAAGLREMVRELQSQVAELRKKSPAPRSKGKTKKSRRRSS